MRKILSALLIALCFSLAACGTEEINSYNYEDYLNVKIDYYIKNEEKSGKSRTADGEVFVTVTCKEPENTNIESISVKASADSPWSITGKSKVELVSSSGTNWIGKITLKANSPLVNTSLKLNAKYLDLDLTVKGEYKK